MTAKRVASHPSEDAEGLLLRVAWYYYKDELTQDEIARRLAISRASVGRLLDRARRSGLVTISINTEHLDAFHLSRQLRERFDLDEALVVPELSSDGQDQEQVNARLARGGAQYLLTHLRPGDLLAVGWGDTVSKTLAATSFDVVGGVSIVTLTGGVDTYLRTFLDSSSDVSFRAPTRASIIPTPIIASSPELAAALRNEQAVRSVLEQVKAADYTLVGIGALNPEATLVRVGYQSASELRRYAEAGVVGDILGQFYDLKGEVQDLEIHRCRIGTDIASLRDMPNVVGVAGGHEKLDAIRGALHGGYLNVLVTNEAVAGELVRDR